ncbi:MAG TPA: LLM class F420-dependent oxidoreductase [Acidimicrobiales bacterium]|nr:LLM class F420-dependent oxidoreductase [Acidimicrobiales bacterium]
MFPSCELGADRGAVRTWAQAVEDLGFSHISCIDHVLGASHANRTPPLWGPHDQTMAFHEPLALFSFLAGVTRQVGLTCGILVLPQRPAVLVAKQAAEIDLLSDGRLRLGVGAGWNPVEYEALGADFASRGARFDEQITLLRCLWRDPLVDFSGRFHRVDRASMLPRPARTIPIWVGGFSPPAFRRAARLGDGCIISTTDPSSARRQIHRLRTELVAAGRDPATYPVELATLWSAGAPAVLAMVDLARRESVDYVTINTMTTTNAWRGGGDVQPLRTPAEHVGALERFIREIGWEPAECRW